MTDTRLLGNRYEVGDILGRGGMATVRRARDTRLGRDVAVKELRIDLASDNTFQERFRREAQAAAGLNHPNIVAVYDTGEDTDPTTGVSVPFIVMELIAGRTLRDVLRDGRPILPRKALEFAVGVLDALAYSHKAGIVHRDIKPANVMITPSGMVKVMDFGIARAVSDTSSTMTQTAAVIGTAQYLSPEQARGETVDARSDLYSAGCLLYELLVGRPPFTGDSPVSVAYQHVRELPTPPSQLDAEVTPAMDAVVLKALAKSPQDRYQSATEMAADLRRLLAGQQVLASIPAMTQTVAAVGPAPAPPVAVLPQPVPGYTSARSAMSATTGMFPAYQQGNTAQTSIVTALPREPEPRRNRWLWPLITGLLLVALVGGTVFLSLSKMNLLPAGRSQVAVPVVTGLDQGIAETNLRDLKLNPVVQSVTGPEDGTVGKVTHQDPGPTTLVDPNTDVNITVNVGPTKVILPMGIKGKDVNAVQTELGQRGFTNVKPTPAASEPPTAKANEVLSVDPAEGSRISAGQQITLYYATGKAQVPNLRGLSKADATKSANAAGFTNLRWLPQQSGQTADTVVDTEPTAFSTANKADPLTLYYAVPLPAQTVVVTSTAPAPPAVTITTTTTTTQAPAPPPATSQPPATTPAAAPATP